MGNIRVGLYKKLAGLFKAQCWGIKQNGERCGNLPKKGQIYCWHHKGQTPSLYIKIKFIIKKYWKLELATLLALLGFYYTLIDLRLTLSIDKLDADINSIHLQFKNESRIFEIRDIHIRFRNVYSRYGDGDEDIDLTIKNSTFNNIEKNKFNFSKIKKISPQRTSSTVYYPWGFKHNKKLQIGEVCIYVNYRVWFLKMNDEYGMYINPAIKLSDWIQRSCDDLPHNT